jgi:tRNA threonylcarbamoyladenosine biosynthesis protein TsaB
MLKNFLTIDTSTDTLYVSLVVHEKVVFVNQEKGSKDHAIKLMPAVIKAFEESQFDPAYLEAIVVGEGPGSYTGIRMGVVVGKMLALEWNISLYKISSLLLMVSGLEGLVAATIDARRDHVFAAVYAVNDSIKTLLKPVYIAKEALKNLHPNAQEINTFQPDILKLMRLDCFEKVDDVSGFTPLYLRQTQAEAER